MSKYKTIIVALIGVSVFGACSSANAQLAAPPKVPDYAKQTQEDAKASSEQKPAPTPASTTASKPNDQKDNQGRGEENRSETATLVDDLLNVAKRSEGIGPEIRQIVIEQGNTDDTVKSAKAVIEARGGFKKFLLGTDYKNIGVLRSEIAKTQARIGKLTALIEKAPEEKGEIETQVSNLKAELDKLQKYVEDNDSVGLFGWVTRIFSK